MYQINSKNEILNYLNKITKQIKFDNLYKFTTIEISKQLNISRTLASQYLNKLVKEHLVIKIISRPVYYLSKEILEKNFYVELKTAEYLSIKELIKDLNENKLDLKDFMKAIGNEGSLNYIISQIKSALAYPQGGLPIILFGEDGCGKSFLVNCMYEYIKNCSNNKDINIVKKKIYKNSLGSKQIEEIFGKKENDVITKGLLDDAINGMLVIYNAEHLSEECQEKLADFLYTGKYTRVNDEHNIIKSNSRLVFTMCSDPHKNLYHKLLLTIPVICQIPSLMERDEDERMQFIIKFFQEEQKKLSRKIFISESLKNFLLTYHFEKNIDELRKCIKTTCANVFVNCVNEENINVYLYHLPIDMLQQIKIDKYSNKEEKLIRVDSIVKNKIGNKILHMWEKMLTLFEYSKNEKNDFLYFIENGQKTIRYYYDILVFQESYQDARLKAMQKIVIDVLEVLRKTKNIDLPTNCAYVITKMVLSTSKNNSLIQQWEQENKKEITECMVKVKEWLSDENILSDLIIRYLHMATNIHLSDMNKIFLMITIRMYNKNIISQDTIGIILSHGYSTASSIADAANSILNEHIFESYDMPLDTSVKSIYNKLNEFIEMNNKHLKSIILLVDMGSLESLGEGLVGNVNIGIINNISTYLAINVGTKIIQKVDLEDILKQACAENKSHYKIISSKTKENAIIFTNDAGILISEKLSRLFYSSLPKAIDLKMIEYDYDTLLKNKTEDNIFKKYNVVLVVKPYNLKLENINSVSLEEIMSFRKINTLNKILKPYLNHEEIEQFNKQLLKNFSLQSIMENLTILNAQKLIDFVSDSVNELQLKINKKFQSKTIIGIYMHVCFLMERLVTKTAIENYKDIGNFIENHQDFIEDVNSSFSNMLHNYNVELPIYEIAYLYGYIENDSK